LDVNGGSDVLVSDLRKRRLERVSVDSHGEPATSVVPNSFVRCSQGTAISPTGRFVTFDSRAQDLVPNDSGIIADWDVFVRDRKTNKTELVSLTSSGNEVNEVQKQGSSISDDGRFVTFHSTGEHVNASTSAGAFADWNVYVHDVRTGATSLVDIARDGGDGAGCRELDGDSSAGSVSGNGRYVAFGSCANNLVRSDPHDGPAYTWDGFVRDIRVPLGSAVTTTINGLGRSGHTSTLDLVGDGGAGGHLPGSDITRASVTSRPLERDLFVRIDVDRLAGPSELGWRALGGVELIYGTRLRVNDVDYELRIGRSVSAPLEPTFRLFRCGSAGCHAVVTLEGGYGTGGDFVTAAVPWGALGLTDGGTIEDVEAFTAYGVADLRTSSVLDVAKVASN
jgi:hypothetical protein